MRAAREADTEAIVELTAAGWRAAYSGIVPRERIAELPLAAWRHDVATGLRSPVADSFTFVAERDAEVLGYCYVAAPGREQPAGSRVAELVAIYVTPARWGQGIGRSLMEAAVAEAEQLGYEEMALWTFERNAQARAFYARLGWRRDGGRRPHAATGVPTIRLRRTLADDPKAAE